MADTYSKTARDLKPYIIGWIRETLAAAGTLATGSGGGSPAGMPATHGLDSSYHTGVLSDSQAPQFLKTDGTRTLVGNLPVGAGYTVDGIDISAHAADPDAHHDTATAGDGIDVTGQQVAVDVTDIIDTSYGLTEDSNNIRVNLAATSGLEFATGALQLADTVAGGGLVIANKILAVNPGNGIEIVSDLVRVDEDDSFTWAGTHQFNVDPQVQANLDFIGAADREITAAQSLILAPATNVVLKPTSGVAELYTGKTYRATTHSDLVTGITGFSLFDRGSNQYQLSAFAGKFDELYARVFVADEVRLDRGEEYWSKSYGIVESDFVIPADEANVDVWFEESPALGTAKIFTAGDWLQCRVIDWTTGIDMQTIWWEVVDGDGAGANDYLQRADQTGSTPDRQQWRLKRKVGGTTGKTIRKGSVCLDVGVVGQGWIHLSALDQDNGPFIQMGSQTSAGTTTTAPVFTNYVRMGNLNGVGGISSDTWGFAAAKNLGTTIGSGYEGLVLDSVNGLRLYNTDIRLYDGSTLYGMLNRVDGLNFRVDTGDYSNPKRYVAWYDDLASLSNPVAILGTFAVGTQRVTTLRAKTPSADSYLVLETTSLGSIQIGADVNINAGSGGAIQLSGEMSLLNGYDITLPTDSVMITPKARAYNANGLRLEDDAGTLGLFVADGGNVGVGTNAPAYALDINATARARSSFLAKGSTTVGSILMSGGDATKTGSIQWYLPSADGALGTRLGYMGYHATDVALTLENGAKFFVGGNAYVNNDLTVAGGFGAWTAVAGSFNTGWGNFDATNYSDVAYRKVGDLVQLRGIAKRSSGTETTIYTLPSGYRPASGQRNVFIALSNGAAARVDVYSGGEVVHVGGGDATQYVSLDGLQFSTL